MGFPSLILLEIWKADYVPLRSAEDQPRRLFARATDAVGKLCPDWATETVGKLCPDWGRIKEEAHWGDCVLVGDSGLELVGLARIENE